MNLSKNTVFCTYTLLTILIFLEIHKNVYYAIKKNWRRLKIKKQRFFDLYLPFWTDKSKGLVSFSTRRKGASFKLAPAPTRFFVCLTVFLILRFDKKNTVFFSDFFGGFSDLRFLQNFFSLYFININRNLSHDSVA